MISKDQRYTRKKGKLTHKGEIANRQITLRMGVEETIVTRVNRVTL